MLDARGFGTGGPFLRRPQPSSLVLHGRHQAGRHEVRPASHQLPITRMHEITNSGGESITTLSGTYSRGGVCNPSNGNFNLTQQ